MSKQLGMNLCREAGLEWQSSIPYVLYEHSTYGTKAAYTSTEHVPSLLLCPHRLARSGISV